MEIGGAGKALRTEPLTLPAGFKEIFREKKKKKKRLFPRVLKDE